MPAPTGSGIFGEEVRDLPAAEDSDVLRPASTIVSTMSVIRNMPNFMPLYSTK